MLFKQRTDEYPRERGNIHNANGNTLIWQLHETTPYNQPEKYKNGNNLYTTHTYSYKTGLISRIQTGYIQDLQYSFNPANGNMNWRRDNKHALQENFGYDKLNRLTSISTVSSGSTINISLHNNGNIIGKDGLGTYKYDASQPHAVSSIVPTGSYSPQNQTATYTSFDKLSSLKQANKQLDITYGYDYKRRKTVLTDGSTTKTKIFVPGGYEKITKSSVTREFYYIATPAGINAIYEKVNGNGAMYYIHSDNLGSVNFITNSSGNTVQELSFDAWGRQRSAYNWSYSSLPDLKFERGFTFHEQLDGFDLVNMNGRMYDPIVGRFLSPDPVLQSPENLQNYNRYSYCLNNPLKYTDPSGYQIRRSEADVWSENMWNSHMFDMVKSGGGGGGAFFNLPGSCGNGTGFGGVYYDWFSGTYRSTDYGNSQVGWSFVKNIISRYSYETVYQGQADYVGHDAYLSNPSGKTAVYALVPVLSAYGTKKASSQGGGNSLCMVGAGLNAAGFAASAGEYSNVINGQWRGANGKWNSTSWGGNQYTGARSKVMSRAGAFKLAGRGVFVVGTGISLYQGGDALLNGDYAGAAKSGFDIGMGAFATFGGPPGWIIGGGYFALDALGVFERPNITTPYIPTTYAVPDNTYVAPPIFPNQ